MTDPNSATRPGRACPGCGAAVDTQYCPHCGSRTVPAQEPVYSAGSVAAAADDTPTVPVQAVAPRIDGPARAVPEMFQTELVPAAGTAQAWSQTPEASAGAAPQSGLFPGWTGMYPAVATAGAQGALAPRPERRRRALYAVAGIAAATVAVLLAALLIAPHLGRGSDVADKDGQPVAVMSTPPSTNSTAQSPPAASNDPAPATGALPGPAAPSTVTVTAAPTAAGSTGAAPGTKVPGHPSAAIATKSTAAPPRTTAKKPAPSKPEPLPLGVPAREIPCTDGYIVQLASDLDAATFAAHVARLKAGGQLPAGAAAADSTRSCKIFSSQSNTIVLYAGPFASKYAGCPARLAGPADAYIKGGSPDTSKAYVSCLCPANAGKLPKVTGVGQQGVWVGELQRVLGARLNIDVGDVTGQWGVYTPGTRSAVQTFQRRENLPANGDVDGRTWKRLQSVGC